MSIDMSRNGAALTEAWKNVTNADHPSTYCLFGYEKDKTTLKVVEVAEEEGEEEDLEELEQSFNDSKIQYAFISITDPNTNLKKIVYIAWAGEGVNPMDKSKFPRHLADVARAYPGAHVSIEARNSKDVEMADVRKKVSKASGANYSVHKEKGKLEMPAETSGSGYQKPTIQSGNASSFKSRFEAGANKEREEKEAEERAEEQRKRNQEIQAQQRESQAQQQAEDRQRREQEERRAQEEADRAAAAKAERDARDAERRAEEQQRAQADADAAAAAQAQADADARAQEEADRAAWEAQAQADADAAAQAQWDADQAAQAEAAPAEEAYDWGVCATTVYDYQATGEDELSFDVGEVVTNIEKIDEGWWRGMNAQNQVGLFPSNYVEEMQQ